MSNREVESLFDGLKWMASGIHGAYSSRSYGGQWPNRDDMVRDDRLLDTPDRRRDRHRYYIGYDLDRHYDHHRYNSYRRIDRGYLLQGFKKAKPHTFDEDMKKP